MWRTRTKFVIEFCIGLVAGAMLVLLLGCAPDVVRLGPGECVVIADGKSITTAGQDCQLRRLYR